MPQPRDVTGFQQWRGDHALIDEPGVAEIAVAAGRVEDGGESAADIFVDQGGLKHSLEGPDRLFGVRSGPIAIGIERCDGLRKLAVAVVEIGRSYKPAFRLDI